MLFRSDVGNNNFPSLSSQGESLANAINDTGQVAGIDQTGAVLWNNGIPTHLGPGYAYAINASGQVVGGGANGEATLWSNSTVTKLNSLGRLQSEAFGINNVGQIVGLVSNGNGDTHATLWENGTATDLNSLISANDVAAGWVLNYARGINDNGSIVGIASNNILGITGQAFLLSYVAAIPEADTSAMLLLGLSLFGFMVRRHKKQYQLTSQAITIF